MPEASARSNNQLLRITFKAEMSRDDIGGASKRTQEYNGGVEFIVPTVENKLELSSLGSYLTSEQRQDMFGSKKLGRITTLNIQEDVVVNVAKNQMN